MSEDGKFVACYWPGERGGTGVPWEKITTFCFIHLKVHIGRPGIELGPPRWKPVTHLLGHGKERCSRLHSICDGTRAETIFPFSAKRTSPFKSAGASVQSTTGSRGVRIRGSTAGYTMFRGSVKSTGYLFHSPVSLSLALLFFNVCQHISTGLYHKNCAMSHVTATSLLAL